MTDEESFTALFERHHADIQRFVRRRAPDLPVSDVVAEVFLVAWRRYRQVPRDNPLPWLYRAARNVLANELRGRQRARRLVTRVAEHDHGPAADHADVVADRLAMAAAFDLLDATDQEVLRLVAWERLGIKDAAAAMGCLPTTFAMRLNRARKRLRAALAPAADTELRLLMTEA